MKKLVSIIALMVFLGVMGFAQNNNATVNQDGNDHEAYIEQVGLNNNAIITQHNSDNWAEIIQKNDNNIVFIDQTYGSHNIAQIKQMGEQQHTFFFQQGSDNVFRLLQEGGSNQVGESASNPFMQDGDGNKFAGVTNGDGLAFVEGGYAEQYDGAILDPLSIQYGDDNIIGLRQGADDMGLIQQFGDGNEALLWQGGGGHDATIIQNGNGNKAHVYQNH